MNIEKLIEAAKEIDRLSQLQEQKSKSILEIARNVKEAYENGDQLTVRNLQAKSRELQCNVVDFGNAILELRKALK